MKVSMRGYKAWRNFRESPKGEVRRNPIPRNTVNKGRKKGWESSFSPGLFLISSYVLASSYVNWNCTRWSLPSASFRLSSRQVPRHALSVFHT
jgi:hypothetical protein